MGGQGTCSWLLIPLPPKSPCLTQGPNWSECQHGDSSPGTPTSPLSSCIVYKLSHITLGPRQPASLALPKAPLIIGLHPERASLLNNPPPGGTVLCLAQATTQHFQTKIRPSIWGSSWAPAACWTRWPEATGSSPMISRGRKESPLRLATQDSNVTGIKSIRIEKEEHWSSSPSVRDIRFQGHHCWSTFLVADSVANHLTFTIVLQGGLLWSPFYRGGNGSSEMFSFWAKLDRSWSWYSNQGESNSNAPVLKDSPIKHVDKTNKMNNGNNTPGLDRPCSSKLSIMSSLLPSFFSSSPSTFIKASYQYVFHNYCQNHVLLGMEAHLSTS